MTGEVQRHAFRHQDAARTALDGGEQDTGVDAAAVRTFDAKAQGRIDKTKCGFRADKSRHGTGLARDEPRKGCRFLRHGEFASDVARASEVFFERMAYDRLDQQRVRRPGERQAQHAARCTEVAKPSRAILSASASVMNVRLLTSRVVGKSVRQ